MFPVVRNIDLKITFAQFEAFVNFAHRKYGEVNSTLAHRESERNIHDLVIYDFYHQKITAAHVTSWSCKAPGKVYNYKLTPSVAMAVFEAIKKEKGCSIELEQFHGILYMALSRYFSNRFLVPANPLWQYA